jgi:hypothetical protein
MKRSDTAAAAPHPTMSTADCVHTLMLDQSSNSMAEDAEGDGVEKGCGEIESCIVTTETHEG